MTNIEEFTSGKVLLINKPYRWTSFDVVNKLRWAIKKKLSVVSCQLPVLENISKQERTNNRSAEGLLPSITEPSQQQEGIPHFAGQPTTSNKIKVGHAGTLDPLATGLLIICTGKETKNIDKYQAREKEYTGTFYIGATTPCFDLEQPVDKTFPTAHITEKMIVDTAKKFIGMQLQTPPLFSAVKIKGKRAYDIARGGKTAVITPREINISEFTITRIALPEVDFKVICSKGTYIRSLARDLGEALKSGAHLISLCRTRIGNFRLEEAFQLEQLIASFDEK